MNERPQPPPTIVEAQQQHAAALKRRERRHATIVVVVGLLLVGAAALAIGRSNTVTMPPGGDGDAAVVPARRPKKRVLQPVLGAAAHHSSDHLPPKVDTAARRLWILPFEMPKGSEPRWLRGALPLLLRSKLDALATLVVDEQHASRSRDVARAAREAARAGVDIVIGGTARVAAGQLRIEAQIVHSHKPTVRKVVKVASAASATRRAVDELARRLASTLQVKIDTPPARRALALWPAGKPALLQLLGRAESALLGAGEPASTAKAAKLYRQLIGADRNLAEAHYGLARALGAARASTVPLEPSTQRLDDNGRRMAAALERAVSARPTFHAALVALAALRARSGNDRRAVELYGRALALCPGDTRTLHGMALAQIGLGRADRALAFLDRAIAIDDDDPDALTSRALVLAIFKRATPRALADSTAARTRRGKRGDAARVELAAAYAQLLAHRAKNCLSGVRRARPKLDPERRPAYAQIVDTLEAACHLAARQMPAAKRINARLAKARKANTAIARQLTLLWRRVLSDLQVRLRALR